MLLVIFLTPFGCCFFCFTVYDKVLFLQVSILLQDFFFSTKPF